MNRPKVEANCCRNAERASELHDPDRDTSGRWLKAGAGSWSPRAGEVRARLPLPFAGRLSLDGAEAVCHQLQEVTRAARALGCGLAAPFGTPRSWPCRYSPRSASPRWASSMCLASGSSPCEPRIDPASLAADAIRNGASLHEVRKFTGHADTRTTELYFVRKEGDAEVAARRIYIRLTGRTGQ